MRPATASPIIFTLILAILVASGTWQANAATTNAVVFLETMATNAAKPWTGNGCNNAWIVSYTGSIPPFEQEANANYGGGNPNGLTFKGGTTSLTDSMITTANGIDARGVSGTLGFYIQSSIVTNTVNWAMQLNSGSIFTYRLFGSASSSQDWQYYSYALQPGDLVSNLMIQFQFAEGDPGNRVFLDQISLTVTLVTNTPSKLNLPDTGQITNYTGTFGEDSDYLIHPPAYVNNGNGTISDKVTGLTWQQTDGGEMTWESATNYPSTNSLAGYNDWRLPTSQELFSLTLQNGASPAINTNYFTLTAANYWWTRDIQLNNATNVWVVDTAGGISPQPKPATISAGGTKRFHVRCVRGTTAPTNSPIHHFTDNGNGTISDADTGLTWQQAETPATNWEGALADATSLTLAGNTDWRVPNVKELQSINDETLALPSVDVTYFSNAVASRYWSSTTVPSATNSAWCLDFQSGVATNATKTNSLLLRCVRGGTTNVASSFNAQFVRIPGGSYLMGDQFGYVDPFHYTDEEPVHGVYITPLYMATTLCTMAEYCAYLNAALYQGLIEVRTNVVYAVGGTNEYFYTRDASAYSFIQYTNGTFLVLSNRDLRPVTSVRWFGAIAYCNWLSQRGEFKACYNLDTGDVNFTNNGFRLPTEAEWEYAAHGGLTNPYCMFPWGTNANANGTYANWQNSGDPFEDTNNYPNTTPVGFYNGSLRLKSDYNWPGSQLSYQTSDGSNPYGLYDMGGNVWEWCNDWYENLYYNYCTNNNVVTNPPGPIFTNVAAYGTNSAVFGNADLFPSFGNLPYRCLRGGTWWNGGDQINFGFARVSNRDPSWSLGPLPDTNAISGYFNTGFRVMRPEKLAPTLGLFLNTTNAYAGYTLMSPMQGTNTYLLNNAGQYVHKWTSIYPPGRADYLMTNGHLMRACQVFSPGTLSTGGGEGGRIEEHDWEGNLVWAFDLNTSTNMMHHDFKVLPNGNLIMLVVELKTLADVVAAGFNTNLLDPSITSAGGFMLPDYVIEVQPTRPYGGNVVWEWHVWDHLIQDYDVTKNNYGVVSNHAELVNVNPPTGKNQQFWNHMNSIDYNAQLDQIALSVRGNSELWIIDHQTTKAQSASHAGGRYNRGGDLLYRWGNPLQYKSVKQNATNQMLWQQHDVQWIPTNCPGAGHLLIHNNGIGRNPAYSSVDEIIPPVDGNGLYSRASTNGVAFGPTTNYWRYTNSPQATNYYSPEISGAQRLPNGNTLICSGFYGTLFEVTSNLQTIWKYVNPETYGPLTQGTVIPIDTANPLTTVEWLNEVFKVHRYPTNFAGLLGKDLTPRGTVEIYSGAATDTVGLGLPDLWVRSHFGSLSAVTATSSHSGNGLSDLQEYLYGLDPTVWSSANDGIPDGWAVKYGFDPTLAAMAGLINANGFTTLQSYTADLNPTNAASRLAFVNFSAVGGNMQITWIGGGSATQYLVCSPTLIATQWTTIYTNLPPTSVTNSVIQTGATATNLFYRIRAAR